jgi:ABC-type amino acid transport substrate-binding protein
MRIVKIGVFPAIKTGSKMRNNFLIVIASFFLFGACEKSGVQAPVFSAVKTIEDLKGKNAQSITKNALASGPGFDGNLQEFSVVFPKTDCLPFYFKDEASGQFAGFAVEAAYKLATHLGAKLTIERLGDSPDETIRSFLAEEHDMLVLPPLPPQTWNPELTLTNPYCSIKNGLLVNRVKKAQLQKPGTSDADFFRSTTASLGVIKSSPENREIKLDLPNARILQFDNLGAAFNGVLKGDILCLYLTETQIHAYLEEDPARNVFLECHLLENTEIRGRFALSPDSGPLRDFINIFLEDIVIKSSGEAGIKSLVHRYMSGREINP